MSDPSAPVFAEPGEKDAVELGTGLAPKFDANGLVTAVVTDAGTGELLMVAHMNGLALGRSVETGIAHYWSRSRSKLWKKGETSGNVQKIIEMRTDCDQDAIWLKVRMEGSGACCHTGHRTCFYRSIPLGTAPSAQTQLEFADTKRLFDPKDVYGK